VWLPCFDVEVIVVISGQLGDDAHRYQERAVAEAIQKAKS
jgi:hypothetical protein